MKIDEKLLICTTGQQFIITYLLEQIEDRHESLNHLERLAMKRELHSSEAEGEESSNCDILGPVESTCCSYFGFNAKAFMRAGAHIKDSQRQGHAA